jgi:hypothetical protein
MLSKELLLKQSDPKQKGVFFIEKCVFLVDDKNLNIDDPKRCDNISYTGVLVSEGTPYQSHSITPVAKSSVSDAIMEVKRITKYEHVIDASPDFYITYLEYDKWMPIEPDPTPSSMWIGKSIFQLFKIMREWSFLCDEPFNSDHPMAEYSKLALETFNPSQEILEEIDSFPDMHLAKFLKNDPNYKLIPHPYPEASEEMKTWIVGLTEKYKLKTFEETLDLL